MRGDGGPAFPILGEMRCDEGMTLRDYFAGQALAGWMADPNVTLQGKDSKSIVAEGCYGLADAMLAAREASL